MTRITRVAAGAQKQLDIAKIEMVKSAKVATATQRELDIARGETRLLNKVISGLQLRLDVLEGRGSVGSDHPPLESGSSDDGWGPGPGPGRPHAPGGAPRSRPSASAPSLSAPSHHSAGRRNERVPPGSGSEEWRDEWLRADYHNRRAPPRTPVRPRRPAPAPEPIPMAGGRYGGLRDEVLGGDVEWDVGGGEDLDLDLDLEEFGITPPRGVRQEAAERGRRRRDEEAYMEGVQREHLGSPYMEEPRRSHADTGEEMEVAAVGVRGRGRWERRSTSRPAFMVSKAADATVWEDLKDIKPPMYDGNPLNLDRFLEKLDDWGVTVTEDMDPADAERYVFKRFRYRLPEVLQELYFVATKEGKIKTLKEAKKWLNEQERVDAPQVAAKRWKSIKLQHDGREIRLRDWRDFRGQYTLFRRNVEDWNEGDEQARLLSMLPEAWIKRVTKEEAKRAKSNHTVKMMLPKEYHTNVVAWTRKNVARNVKRYSLRNALLITVSGDREKTAMWLLDECDVSGQTICLQAIPARMSCDEILEWVGEEVVKEYRNLHHTRGLRPGDRNVNYVGEGSGGEAAMNPAGADGDETLVDDDDDDEPAEMAVCALVANNLNAGSNRGSRVGTIQYVYRSVSIPYSTPVSCMVSPSPNEDPVGTTKCPLNPWFYDIFELIPTTKLLSQKHQKISTNICYHRPAFKCFSKHPANDSHLKLFASLLCTTLPAVQPKRQRFLKHRANDFSALPCLALQLRHKEYFNVDFTAHCLLPGPALSVGLERGVPGFNRAKQRQGYTSGYQYTHACHASGLMEAQRPKSNLQIHSLHVNDRHTHVTHTENKTSGEYNWRQTTLTYLGAWAQRGGRPRQCCFALTSRAVLLRLDFTRSAASP